MKIASPIGLIYKIQPASSCNSWNAAIQEIWIFYAVLGTGICPSIVSLTSLTVHEEIKYPHSTKQSHIPPNGNAGKSWIQNRLALREDIWPLPGNELFSSEIIDKTLTLWDDSSQNKTCFLTNVLYSQIEGFLIFLGRIGFGWFNDAWNGSVQIFIMLFVSFVLCIMLFAKNLDERCIDA